MQNIHNYFFEKKYQRVNYFKPLIYQLAVKLKIQKECII